MFVGEIARKNKIALLGYQSQSFIGLVGGKILPRLKPNAAAAAAAAVSSIHVV